MENKIIEAMAVAVTWLDRETRRGATEGDAS